MRGQVAIAAVAVLLTVTLILLAALPKRTLGPDVSIQMDAIINQEIEHMLRDAVEEAVFDTARMAGGIVTSSDVAQSLQKTFIESLQYEISQKAATYLALRDIYCTMEQPTVEVSSENNYYYISHIYVVLKCVDMRTNEEKIAFVNARADVSVEVKNVGFTKGVRITVKLYRDQVPIYLILYGSSLYVQEGDQWQEFEILGSYSPRYAIWFFNVTADHVIKLALPPEFSQNQGTTWYMVVAAASMGQGAGTVVVVENT